MKYRVYVDSPTMCALQHAIDINNETITASIDRTSGTEVLFTDFDKLLFTAFGGDNDQVELRIGSKAAFVHRSRIIVWKKVA